MAKKIQVKKGDKYNRLTIIEEVEQKLYKRYFKCKCECGNIKTYELSHIRNGSTKSCGCYNLEVLKDRQYKHGMSKTKIYKLFTNIKDRCNNSKCYHYDNYGARGIKCLWNNFEEFYKDMGESYQKGLSIDRINNNGNYCKENCRWATMKEQGRNRRSNILYKGKCISEWCEELGLNKYTVYTRISRNNGNIQQALEL